jgi:hypothetical protein
MRGRRPTPTAILLARGTFRQDRHGSRIDAPTPGELAAARMPSAISEAEQAARRDEIDAQRKAIYGEAGPSDPGPRSVGKARRIPW